MFNSEWLLTDLQLHKHGGEYYLSAKYIIEEEHRTQEVSFPKIVLPLTKGPTTIIGSTMLDGNDFVDIGFGELPIGAPPVCKVIKEKSLELTPDEIEKRLGYKVKIVSSHIKTFDLCKKCRYGGGHYFHDDCTKCPMYDGEDSHKGYRPCKCLNIDCGKPCSYFKEAKE